MSHDPAPYLRSTAPLAALVAAEARTVPPPAYDFEHALELSRLSLLAHARYEAASTLWDRLPSEVRPDAPVAAAYLQRLHLEVIATANAYVAYAKLDEREQAFARQYEAQRVATSKLQAP